MAALPPDALPVPPGAVSGPTDAGLGDPLGGPSVDAGLAGEEGEEGGLFDGQPFILRVSLTSPDGTEVAGDVWEIEAEDEGEAMAEAVDVLGETFGEGGGEGAEGEGLQPTEETAEGAEGEVPQEEVPVPPQEVGGV